MSVVKLTHCMPMKKEADKLENKSTLEINTATACSRDEARKHVSGERLVIGFGLVWLKLAVMPTKINVKYFRHLAENRSKRKTLKTGVDPGFQTCYTYGVLPAHVP